MICFKQCAPIVLKPSVETPPSIGICCYLLSSGEAFSVLFEALDAEKLAANQVVRFVCKACTSPALKKTRQQTFDAISSE
jgi:hypothetical protein